MIHFQDVPTGSENISNEEDEIVEEEGVVSRRQEEAEEEEKDSFAMSKPRREVTYQNGCFFYFFPEAWVYFVCNFSNSRSLISNHFQDTPMGLRICDEEDEIVEEETIFSVS